MLQILAVTCRNRLVNTDDYVVVQVFHIDPFERRIECDHFVENTPERPYIRLMIVRQILPYFGAGIIRGASLRHTEITYFGNIHISKFDLSAFIDENIR
jgi:hypothetical protein